MVWHGPSRVRNHIHATPLAEIRINLKKPASQKNLVASEVYMEKLLTLAISATYSKKVNLVKF